MFLIIYIVTFAILLILSIVMMAKGFTVFDYTKPKKNVHLEMADVKEGTELMGVTFSNPEDDKLSDDFNQRVQQLRED